MGGQAGLHTGDDDHRTDDVGPGHGFLPRNVPAGSDVALQDVPRNVYIGHNYTGNSHSSF